MATKEIEEPSLAATGEGNPQRAETNPLAGSGAPPQEGQTRLQDLLPEITNLAQRVGGMKKLAEIVSTLSETKKGE